MRSPLSNLWDRRHDVARASEPLVAARKDALERRVSDIAVAKTVRAACHSARSRRRHSDNVVGCRRWRYENVASNRPTGFPAASFRERPTAQQLRGRRRRAARRTCSDLQAFPPTRHARFVGRLVRDDRPIRQTPVCASACAENRQRRTVSAGGGSGGYLRSTTRENPA